MNSLSIAEYFLTMASFMDGLRDCLADGWTVGPGELGYFTPLSSYTSFSRYIFNDGIMPTVTWRISTEFPLHAPRALLPRLTGHSAKQAINGLNQLIEDEVLMGHGEGRSVVYAEQLPETQSYVIKIGFPRGMCFLFRAVLVIAPVGSEI